MAAGKVFGRFEAALGIVGLLALATTLIVVTGWNPGPGLLDWLQRTGAMSRPETSWAARMPARPDFATVTGDAVVVFMRGAVEARDKDTGDEIWTRDVPWAAIAGADSGTVVVVGRPSGRGYEVIDPATGAVRWNDADALGVWTYRELVLGLTCASLSDCTLAARSPAAGDLRWRTPLPGIGKVLAGVNHDLLGSRALAASTVDHRVNAPVEIPPVLGFPLDGRVQVVDTATGRRLTEATSSETTRVVVIGGRVLRSTAERRQGQCRYTLEAKDPSNGRSVWRKEGYDLRTASGAGCEQRRDPSGAGGAISAVRGDNREVLLDAASGRELWVGADGEHALSTDGRIALVRSGSKIKSVDLGGRNTLWEQDAGKDTEVLLARHAALLMEGDRVRAFEPGSGRLVVDARTGARVVGCGSAGLVLSAGRTVGLLPFGSVG